MLSFFLKVAVASACAAAATGQASAAGQLVFASFSDLSCTTFAGNITIPYSSSSLSPPCYSLSPASNAAVAALRGSNNDGPPPVQYVGFSRGPGTAGSVFAAAGACPSTQWSVSTFTVSSSCSLSTTSCYTQYSYIGNASLCVGSYLCASGCTQPTPTMTPSATAMVSPLPSFAPATAPMLYIALFLDSQCSTSGFSGSYWSTIAGTCTGGGSGIFSGSAPFNWPLISTSSAIYSFSDNACTLLIGVTSISSCVGSTCSPGSCVSLSVSSSNAPPYLSIFGFARVFSVSSMCNSSSYRPLPGMDVFGPMVSKPMPLQSEELCQAACCATPFCTAYSFIASDLLMGPTSSNGVVLAPCFLYSNITALVPSSGMSSGALYSSYS